MKKFVAVVAIALMVASCGSNASNEVVTDSTAVATDSTSVVIDSTKVDSSVVK